MAEPSLREFTAPLNYSVVRKPLRPGQRTPVGSGMQAYRDLWQRTLWGFVLRATMLTREEEDYIASFVALHGTSRPFWFSGVEWGTFLGAQLLVAYADGVRTQYFLPNRNILDGPSLFVNTVLTNVASVNKPAGLVTFASPPAFDATIIAQYTCRYKCVFDYSGEEMTEAENYHQGLFQYGSISLREVYP